MMVPMSLSNEFGEGILFLFGGVLQIFWTAPVIKRWGVIWQIIGIVGTIIFTVLWFVTHLHSLFGSLQAEHMLEGAPVGNASHGEFVQGNMTGSHFPRGPLQEELQACLKLNTFRLHSLVSTLH